MDYRAVGGVLDWDHAVAGWGGVEGCEDVVEGGLGIEGGCGAEMLQRCLDGSYSADWKNEIGLEGFGAYGVREGRCWA